MPSSSRIALYMLAGTVVLGTILAAVGIIAGVWDWFQVRIIFTSYTISGASICALACAAVWERAKGRLLPGLGLVLSIVGAALMMPLIWAEIDSDTYARATITTILFAAATAHVCLLSLARLKERFAWALAVAYVSIYGLAALLALIVWIGPGGSGVFQLLGVVAVVVAGVSVLIPIFHGLSRSEPNPTVGAPIAALCPCCASAQNPGPAVITCPRCGSVFAIRIIRDSRVVSTSLRAASR
jgi:hypothetical protein